MILDLLVGARTRKAQVSALVTGLAAGLTALLPDLRGGWATAVTVALAVIAAFGITYQTPNREEASNE